MQQEESKRRRREELLKLDDQELLLLARRKGINLLNGAFVIDSVLDEEFPDLKEPHTEIASRMAASSLD